MTFNPEGIDIQELITHKESGQSVSTYTGGQSRSPETIIDIECDIWIPAARPDVIYSDMHVELTVN